MLSFVQRYLILVGLVALVPPSWCNLFVCSAILTHTPLFFLHLLFLLFLFLQCTLSYMLAQRYGKVRA